MYLFRLRVLVPYQDSRQYAAEIGRILSYEPYNSCFLKKIQIQSIILREVISRASFFEVIGKTRPPHFKGGYITIQSELKIGLKEGGSKERNTKTFIHELAHLFLGHTSNDFIFNNENNKQKKIELRSVPYRIGEIEAETVSFLLCSKMGSDGHSIEYIAGYFKSEEDFQLFNYSKVIQTTD